MVPKTAALPLIAPMAQQGGEGGFQLIEGQFLQVGLG